MTVTLPTEDYSPIYVGDTGAVYSAVFVDAINDAIPLVGATLSTRMTNQYGTSKTWGGSWTIDDATNGLAHYNYQSGDVDTAGTWTVQTTITIGGKPQHTDTKQLVILATV